MASTLRVLMLEDNKLTALPSDLSDCRNLRVLNLARNKLTHLPMSFLKLELLSELHLAANPLAHPLDDVVRTSSYFSPQEIDMDRAVRKLVSSMTTQLKAASMNPSAAAEHFSPQPFRAALELFFKKLDKDRTGYINERDFRECMNGRRFDFRGITLTPAEVEAVVEHLFTPNRDTGTGARALQTSMPSPMRPGHAPPSMAANAAAGATHLLLEEFIQSVEQSQRKHAVAPLASVVRKYLTVKQRQADLRAEAFHNRPDLDEVRDMDVSGCSRSDGMISLHISPVANPLPPSFPSFV